MKTHLLFGFHAVGVRLKTHPSTLVEVLVDRERRDPRMRQFLQKLEGFGVRPVEVGVEELDRLVGGASRRHQGVAARVQPLPRSHSLDDTLDAIEASGRRNHLVLALDGITDPHNLGACLRVADGTGVAAVVAPVDHAAGVNATVSKVASGAAETVPYFMVTNLARTLNELKERGLQVVGTSDAAADSLYDVDLSGPTVVVLGAEGQGLRALTARTCDRLVRIPMLGAVESLNVSVATGVVLYEAVRQRLAAGTGDPVESPPAPDVDEMSPEVG
jgi:23S rRNA (guanosine2251-2'-O)-methyltransferase